MRGRGEIDRRLGVASAAQDIERPDDACRSHVEVLQRVGRLPPVPFFGRPEPVRVECAVRVGHDRADCVADAPLVPGLVRQRLEELGLVEHQRSNQARIAE